MYAWDTKDGPFESPPGGGESVKYFDDGWYTGRMIAEPCPVCNIAHEPPVPGELLEGE